jgi:pimeloyl-ACP methyl ester carboxylesterase
MDAAGFETAHLVGNSMGGAIVLELARRGRAKSVVAISPAGLGTTREWVYTKTVLVTLRALARALSPAAPTLARLAPTRALMLASACARGWKATPEQAVGEVRALAGATGWDETLEALGRYRAQGLPDIRCPTLIMWGTLDLILPVRQAERFARLIPDAQLQILPRLGHSPMTDDPELIARLITEHTQGAQLPTA